MENGKKDVIMKKFCFYIALSVMAVVTGCQMEEMAAPESNGSVMEVYASIEDIADTRTYMDGAEVLWSSGDQIAVFLKNTLRKRFTVTPESVGGKDATFLYDSEYIMMGNNTAISNNVAYYPFCDVTCAADGRTYTLGNITLPSVQSYAASSAAPGAYPMVAVTSDIEDVNYYFKNVCGAMMFQLKGYGFIKSVTVRGNSDEVLAGSAIVTAAHGDLPSVAVAADGSKVVTLDCGNGVELDAFTPTSFFIVLPPVPFTNGFTVTVTDTWGGTKEYSTSKKNSILRSTILRMPVKEYIGVRPPQEGDYIDEYGISHGPGIEIDGVVWAPVNCGYKAPTADSKGYPYGKLYQWGRKYGQGYDGDAVAPVIESGPVSLSVGQSESSKGLFYTTSDYPYDWLYDLNDALWNLGTSDDPVKTEYDPCPDGWRVPTYVELAELENNYSSWTTEASDQYGYWFSGSNSYSEKVPRVFLPASGMIDYDLGNSVFRNVAGYYWTSFPYDFVASHLYFQSNTVYMIENLRAYGRSIRCVKDDSELIPVESVTLNESTMTLSIGGSASLSAAIVPANANHQFAYWWSENDEVATVDSEGNVTAVSEGTVTITAMAGMQTATCEVVVIAGKKYVDEYGVDHGAGVEIDGVVWAPVNCGYHETDFPYGKYYQWGRKFGQKYSPSYMNGPAGESVLLNEKYADIFFWASYGTPFDWYGYSDPTLWNTGTEEAPVKTKYDPCPEGWRVPTYTELTALSANRDSEMSVHDGQKGYWFNDMAQNSGSTGVFLPAAGFIYYDAGSYDQGKEGCYWSSTASSKYYSQRYSFTRTNSMDTCRGNGFSVRCVAE